ncbi:glycosyltransferase family 2 protein [Methanocaldococcus indicus]|uniref:glycosyltransferase family 2 protein n=1 Tax=Methanocaldococcus indicus TaxID=213231 RepID=UPI003C6CEB1D
MQNIPHKAVVVIPAYNEEKNILKVLNDLEKIKIDVIVVDDGSKDKTYKVVEDYKKNSKIKVFLLKNKKNFGKAKSIEKGVNLALSLGYEYIVFMDGDYQHKPKDIPKLLSKIKDADAVFGIRRYKNIPFYRQISNFLASLLISLLISLYVKKIYIFRDIQCGFRVIKAEFLRDMYFGEGYAVEHLVAIQLAKRRAKILEEYVDIEYHDEAISYITTKKILDVIKQVIKYIVVS